MISNLRDISILKEHCGYSVAKDIPKSVRQCRLIVAVHGLGLYEVVFLISGHIRLRERQANAYRWAECIEKWETDLEWLKNRYYDEKRIEWCWTCLVTNALYAVHREYQHFLWKDRW